MTRCLNINVQILKIACLGPVFLTPSQNRFIFSKSFVRDTKPLTGGAEVSTEVGHGEGDLSSLGGVDQPLL